MFENLVETDLSQTLSYRFHSMQHRNHIISLNEIVSTWRCFFDGVELLPFICPLPLLTEDAMLVL